MEPATAKVKYVIESHVLLVNEEMTLKTGYKDAEGNFPTFQTSLGYYVLLAGSREKLFLGYERPALKEGDKVKITIEKVEDEQ